MKFIFAMILAVVSIVPAVADGGQAYCRVSRGAHPGASGEACGHVARGTCRASPQGHEARKRDTAAARAKQTAEITAKLAAAKAACGPDCYRVIFTNGVAVGMTRAQYEAYQAASASNKVIRAKGTKREKRR